jgi:hypothetical protein
VPTKVVVVRRLSSEAFHGRFDKRLHLLVCPCFLFKPFIHLSLGFMCVLGDNKNITTPIPHSIDIINLMTVMSFIEKKRFYSLSFFFFLPFSHTEWGRYNMFSSCCDKDSAIIFTNGLTCLPKHGGARDKFWSRIQ